MRREEVVSGTAPVLVPSGVVKRCSDLGVQREDAASPVHYVEGIDAVTLQSQPP